ncbi:hypothetical protein FOA52_015006 [Chlamydomonas sp. UWO 241]|nr:hypothetical protein FOA52_015006 [Chlamydomonas sp. UWO 241]
MVEASRACGYAGLRCSSGAIGPSCVSALTSSPVRCGASSSGAPARACSSHVPTSGSRQGTVAHATPGDYAYPPVPSGDYAYPSAPPMPGAGDSMQAGMGEAARKALNRATRATLRYGWTGFWVQLTLSVISSVILLFSVAFTSQSGPRASLYLTLIGILAGFLSTFWNWSLTRLAMRMRQFLDSVPGEAVPKVKKQNVVDTITKGVLINVLGLGSTLLGIQAIVGVLVAKTLSNASANPFIASAAGVYNPVLALDVFLVQAATNTLLGHFLSLVCSLWLLNIVGEGRGLRFQRFVGIQRLKQRVSPQALGSPPKASTGKGTARMGWSMPDGMKMRIAPNTSDD